MKTMKECNEVRRLFYIEEKSKREIARLTGISRPTISRILKTGAPPAYTRRESPRKPVLGPFIGIIDAILKEDKDIQRKQRHTAKRIFNRLREEHSYPGGYTQVREYVAQAKSVRHEAYVPLEFEPGEAQVDWGEAIVFDATNEPPDHEPPRQRKVYLFVMTPPNSGGRFVASFPRQTQEFFFEGHRLAFEYFQGVPRRILYDNLRSAVVKVLRGRNRKLNKTFQDFSDRYLFEPAFRKRGQIFIDHRLAMKKAGWKTV